MTVLGALARREPSNAIQSTPWGDWSGSASTTAAGQNVTTTSALQLLTVYGCDRFISDGIATLPVGTYRKGASGEPVETETPDWVLQPTRDLNRVAWTTQVLSSLLLAGNAYLYVVRGGRSISQLIPFDPGAVRVFRYDSGPLRNRKGYRINGEEVDPFNILHIPGVMFPGSLEGLSPIEAARQSIGLGLAAAEFGGQFFGDSATMAGVIETPQEMTPDKAREMARTWDRTHSGPGKGHKTGVLVGGAQWKQTSVTNEQAQFLETRGYTAAEIAGQMFLIDPSDLGIGVTGSSLTYANITERNLRRVQVTYLPWIVRLEMAITSLLPVGEYHKINVNGLLRGDTKSRYESYKVGIDEDFLQVEEIRAWEELPPLPSKPAEPPDLAGQIEAVGQLIRAGFDPAAALELFGLPPIAHTGLVPVTVTTPGG